MKRAGWLRAHLAACPLVCPALAAAASVAYADSFRWGWIGLFLLAFVVSFLSRPKSWILVLFIGILAGLLHWERVRNQSAVADLHGDWWEGEMLVASEERQGRVLLKFAGGKHEGQSVQAWLGRGEHGLDLGGTIFAEGRMIGPRVALNPDVFPESEWLRRQGVHAVFVVRKIKRVSSESGSMVVQRAASKAREWAKQRLTLGMDAQAESAKVVNAMVLGERPESDAKLLRDFRYSGAIHVFAVSGLHVMMVGTIVASLLRLCGCPRSWWIPIVIASMFFYALVTGLRPPALRAAVMGAVLLSAWMVRRRIVLMNSIALGAVVALLWDGHMLFLAGFQLSFAVLVAIALLGGIVSKCFAWVSYVDPFLPRSLYSRGMELSLWLRRKVEGGTVVGSCAWCGSSPLTLWHFGLLTPISILVSLPMVLILYCVLICSAISLVLGSIWTPLGVVSNRGARFFAESSLSLAAGGAAVPAGHYTEAEWSVGERVVIYTMPEGEAAVYLGLGGGAMLDVGSERGFRRQVLPSLLRKGARLDSLIVSHTDVKHSGGVAELLKEFELKQAVLPVERRGELGGSVGLRLLRAEEASKLALGSTSSLEVVYAPVGRGGVADDRCAVFRLHWHDKQILFVNDAGYRFESWSENNEVEVAADVLVLGKHAHDLSGGIDFIKRVQPAVVIAPMSAVRSQAWKGQLEELGIELFVLEKTGAVDIELNQGVLDLQGFVSGASEVR